MKNRSRLLTVLLYIVVFAVAVVLISEVFFRDDTAYVNYSTVCEQFRSENVRSFEYDNGVLTLELRKPYQNETYSVSHKLADLGLFYEDLGTLIAEQQESGVLQSYNYVPMRQTPWYVRMLPEMLLSVIMIALVYMVLMRNSGGMMKFGHANARVGSGRDKVMFSDVAGADEEKAELQEIVDFLRDPAKYRRIGASLAEDTTANAAFLDAESAYNRFAYDHYTDVPDDIHRFLTEKLSGWEKEPGQTHFDLQRAKQNILFYLTTYASYTDAAAAPPAGTDPILYFLDGAQTGGDAQYAAAAAMMFRYYGIPARCVEGFLVTKDDAASMAANRPLTLTGQSGHTWVEYYQDGVGWLPFEVAPPYLSVMEQAESYQNVSGLVGQAPPDTENNQEPDTPNSDLTQTLREFWLKHRLTILLTLSCILAAAAMCLFTGWLICQRRRTARRKARFADPDVSAAVDAIYRYTMDVLHAAGLPAANCAPAAYAPYLDEDLREEYRAVTALWEQARFSAVPMGEPQRRRALALKEQIWTRTWRRAKPGEKLRLKYKEFL